MFWHSGLIVTIEIPKNPISIIKKWDTKSVIKPLKKWRSISWVMPFISGRELMNLFGKRKAIKIECAFFVIKTNDLFFKFGSFFFWSKTLFGSYICWLICNELRNWNSMRARPSHLTFELNIINFNGDTILAIYYRYWHLQCTNLSACLHWYILY